jgi:hypothetical protein
MKDELIMKVWAFIQDKAEEHNRNLRGRTRIKVDLSGNVQDTPLPQKKRTKK